MASLNSTHNTSSLAANWTDEERRAYLEQLDRNLFVTLLPTVLFITALIAVGLPANLLVLAVYLKRFPPSSTRVFILALAACDLLISCVTLPHLIVTVRFTYLSLGLGYCRIMKVMSTWPIVMSYWLLVCVALDRRHRICRPFRRQLTALEVRHLLALPFTLTCLVLLPFVPLYVEKRLETDVPGLSGSKCELPSVYLGLNVTKISSCIVLIGFLLGLSTAAGAYLQIFWQIYRQKKKVGHRDSFVQSVAGEKQSHRKALCHTDLETNTNIVGNSGRCDVQCECESTFLVSMEEPSGVSERARTPARGLDRHAQKEGMDIGKRDDHVSILLPGQPDLPDDPETGKETGNPSVSKCNCKQEVEGQVGTTQLLEIVNSPDDKSSQALQCTLTEATPKIADTEQFLEKLADGRGRHSLRADDTTSRTFKRGRRVRVCLGRTTLIMFLSSVAAIVCCVPYFAMELAQVEYLNKGLSPLLMNLCFLAHSFPCLNNVINPIIYSFFNPKFRLQCRRLLTSVHERLF